MKEVPIEERVASALLKAGFQDLAPEAAGRLEAYAREVDLWSARVHLVGKGSIGENIELLILDSLLLLRIAELRGLAAGRTADVGSGAGFPGMVWKILRPALDITLFERRQKPQLFLERAVLALRIEGVKVVGGEAERYEAAGTFDLVISKAAGRLDVMLPLAERLLAPCGAYLTVKGRGWKSEAGDQAGSGMRLDGAAPLPEKRGTAVIYRKGDLL